MCLTFRLLLVQFINVPVVLGGVVIVLPLVALDERVPDQQVLPLRRGARRVGTIRHPARNRVITHPDRIAGIRHRPNLNRVIRRQTSHRVLLRLTGLVRVQLVQLRERRFLQHRNRAIRPLIGHIVNALEIRWQVVKRVPGQHRNSRAGKPRTEIYLRKQLLLALVDPVPNELVILGGRKLVGKNFLG